MPALLAAIEAAVAYILQVLGITQLMYGLLQQFGVIISTAAQEHYKFEIQGYTLAANQQLSNPTYGLAALKAELDTISAGQIALGNPQQTAQPVTLPTVAPAGYGGTTASAAADAVWSYIPVGFGQTMAFFQENAGLFAVNLSTSSLRVGLADQMRWSVYGSWVNSNGPDLPDRDVPSLDPGTILPTDTDIAAWINRVQPGYLAYLTPEHWATIDGSNGFNYLYDLSPWEFETIRANNAPGTWGASGAPVWPGLANVTLGAPVTMTPPGDYVAVPCDGVIIAVTGTPSWAGSFSFGTAVSYRNVGAVTFTDDNGEQEFAQTFSWTSGVYCPKSMRSAAGFAYRAAIGVSGTVTPFTIN